MAGQEPRVPYNPNPDVQPGADAPNDYLRASASPEAFGSQVGQATQGLGKSVENLGQPMIDYALKRQGQINEAAAINGETEANISYGQIFDQLRSQKGFAAAAAVPNAVAQAQQIRQKLREQMPNDAAAKAFDTLIARTEGFVIRDMHSYGDTEFKSGHSAALTANRKMWVDRFARPEIAFNDDAWNENMAGALASASHELENNGIVGDSEDAKLIRDEYMRTIKSEAWSKRIITVADDPQSGSVKAAVGLLEKNKEDIPSDAYSALSRSLAGRYHSAETREIADQIAGPNGQIWHEQQEQNSQPASSENVVKAFHDQEFDPKNPNNNPFQIQSGTWSQWAKPGEDINNPVDNQAVATRMLQQYAKDYDGDMSRVAVAYFSGPGNVAPKGSATPWIENKADKNGKTVASYADDIMRRTQGMELGGGTYLNKEDYIQMNYDKILQKAQDESDKRFPGQPDLAYQAVSRTSQYLRSVLYQEHQLNQNALNTVNQFATDMDGKGTPMTTQYQIDTADSRTKAAWERMQQQYPVQSRAFIDRITSQNLSGKATSYGDNFYQNFKDVLSGKKQNILDLSTDLDGIKLTNTGYNSLHAIMDQNNTPEGKAFNNSMADFYSKVHNAIVVKSLPGMVDDKGEDRFVKFMQATLPEIAAKKKQGLSAGDMFNPDSKDYVGNQIHLYDRSTAQKLIDMKASQANMAQRMLMNRASVQKFDLKSFDRETNKDKGIAGLLALYNLKSTTPQQKSDIIKYSESRGWTTANQDTGVPNAGGQQ